MFRRLFKRAVTAVAPLNKVGKHNQIRLIHSISGSCSNRVTIYKLQQKNYFGSTAFGLLDYRDQRLPIPKHILLPVRGKKSKKKKKNDKGKNSSSEEEEDQSLASEPENKTAKKGTLEGNLEEGKLVDMDAVLSRMNKIIDAFGKRLSSLRTGRTDPAMLDSIQVHAYGSKQSLSNVAQASLQSAKLLHVSVFDPSLIADVEKAIRNSGMNLNPTVDGSTIKVPVPKTTKESREEVAKVAREARETTKRSILAVRGDAVKVIKNCKGEPGISEDDLFGAQEEVDKEVEKMNSKIQEMFQKREKDILEN
mmetsp:Transcript_13169/g.16404  ORF Transcript_13169/g.16404 Transcript_13169/m.16404 type:complete len:308 (-) Transcript_13169:781-1704(-)